MTEIECIYCKQLKPISEYSKKEHVISQSFGMFSNNLTLNDCVCDSCNQFFGDNLEIDLARDTFEGLYRFKHGVKESSEFKSLGKRSRLKIRVNEGRFKGAYVYLEYSHIIGKIIIRPIQQIGFYNLEKAEYSFYSLDEIPLKSILEENGFDLTRDNAIMVIGIDSEQAKEILATKGVVFQSGGNMKTLEREESEWEVEIEATFDLILLRAIAKIAFNYFSYWVGAELARQPEFDVIRSYILKGIQPHYPLVVLINKSILADEYHLLFRRLGLIVTLNWAHDRKSIVSQVSLFNQNTYSICVSRDYPRDIRNLAHGNFFDISSKKIFPLQSK